MPADFEAATGIKVRLDIYENNEEMVAKLQAGGVSQYDIIVIYGWLMIDLRWVMKQELRKLPGSIRARIEAAIEGLADDPRPPR